LQKLVQVEKTKLATRADANEIPIIRAVEDENAWHIEVKKNKVIVRGLKIERFASRTDFASEDAVRRLRDIMRKLAIMKAFERQNVEAGSKVYFGDNREDYLEY